MLTDEFRRTIPISFSASGEHTRSEIPCLLQIAAALWAVSRQHQLDHLNLVSSRSQQLIVACVTPRRGFENSFCQKGLCCGPGNLSKNPKPWTRACAKRGCRRSKRGDFLNAVLHSVTWDVGPFQVTSDVLSTLRPNTWAPSGHMRSDRVFRW